MLCNIQYKSSAVGIKIGQLITFIIEKGVYDVASFGNNDNRNALPCKRDRILNPCTGLFTHISFLTLC